MLCEVEREALAAELLLLLLLAMLATVGVEGSGFTVMLDRALSVLEPVMELKREPASFLVIVTSESRVEQRRPKPKRQRQSLAGANSTRLLMDRGLSHVSRASVRLNFQVISWPVCSSFGFRGMDVGMNGRIVYSTEYGRVGFVGCRTRK